MSGPRWIKQWISDMAELNEQFRNDDGLVDFEALGREEYSFRVALITKKFAKSERAREIYRVAKISYDSSVDNGKKGGRPKKSPQDAPNGNAGDELSDAGNGAASKSPTSCDTLTADGDTREGAEAINRRESGAVAPTTVSRNMRQSAKTRDNRESGRYAQPSCSPEDGNHYDQDASISTDDPQPEGLTGPSHGGSVASLEARESQALESQRRTGGSSVRGMAKVAQPPVRPRAKNSRCPNSREDFHAFVADNNLHEGLAEEWYAMHEAREWVDRDGKPIKDWRGALYNYCTKTEQKRRTA